MKILSVDWDFFFPCLDGFDWGMNEDNNILQEFIWHVRYSDKDIITGKYAYQVEPDYQVLNRFWGNVLNDSEIKQVVITESHSDIRHFLYEGCQVYNFDAHHDFGYKDDDEEELNCGNWAKHENIYSYEIIYPSWRKEVKEINLKPIVDFKFYDDYQPKVKYDLVFICRSSCWTPSWHDVYWLNFIDELKCHTPFIVWENKLKVDWVMKKRVFDKHVAYQFAESKNRIFDEMGKREK